MSTAIPEHDPVAKARSDISEMVASAKGAKGEIFAEVATAWFESLQAVKLIAKIRVKVGDDFPEIVPERDAAAHLCGTSSARIVGLLGGDEDEAMNLAKRLISILERAQASIAKRPAS